MSVGALNSFQDAFSRVLVANARDEHALTDVTSQPGFAVYRNTVTKGCIDALEANFPSGRSLVGEEWFRAAAAVYARENLPVTATLLEYGRTFVEFLRNFAPAAELPYLADIATLDRHWTEAHIARDEETLNAARIAALAPGELARCRLVPHASARWSFFDRPIVTIWRRCRAGHDDLSDVAWTSEGVLIARPHFAVEATDIDVAACAFLDACANGDTLAGAAARSVAADPQVDLTSLMARLLEAGAFSNFHIIEGEQT